MICPKCKRKTEVLETSQRDAGPVTRRRRRCMACGHRFSTIEALISEHAAMPGTPLALALSMRRSLGKRIDVEAVAAAIAVDRRKAKIKREQRERERIEREYDEHAAPSSLRGDTFKREVRGY